MTCLKTPSIRIPARLGPPAAPSTKSSYSGEVGTMIRGTGAPRGAAQRRRLLWDAVSVVAPAVAATAVSVFAARANSGLGHVPGQAASMAIAAAAGLVLLLRRRLPMTVLFVTVVAFGADTVVVPLVLAVYTAAAHERTWWRSVLGMVAAIAAVAVSAGSWPGRLTGVLLAVAAPAVIGLYVGGRRTMIRGLRERAVAAEREAHLSAENARLAERARIAREMHDVLGHKVTIISVQAAALEVMPSAADPAVQERVRIIADTSRESLTEVREILGLLDAQTVVAESDCADTPVDDVERLVVDANHLGITTTYSVDLTGRLPETAADAVYRVVQEGLTNAAKHAPGSHVTVNLDDRDGIDVTIASTQPAPGAPAVAAGLDGGHGLRNLRTRVRDAGGLLTASVTVDGGFLLKAWLPKARP